MIGVAGGLALTGHAARSCTATRRSWWTGRTSRSSSTSTTRTSARSWSASAPPTTGRSPGAPTSPRRTWRSSTPWRSWTVHVPGHPDEVAGPLRAAVRADNRVYLRLSDQQQRLAAARRRRAAAAPRRPARPAPLVIAVGPVLDDVLAAVADLDVNVAYTNRPRPFDTAGLRALAGDRGDPGGAVPGRDLQPGRRRGARRPAAPAAGARRGPDRPAALRHGGRPRPRARAGRRPGCAPRSPGSSGLNGLVRGWWSRRPRPAGPGSGASQGRRPWGCGGPARGRGCQIASTPSFQVIFLPSSRPRAR